MSSVNPDEEYYNSQQAGTEAASAAAPAREWAEDPGTIGGTKSVQEPFPREALGVGLADLSLSFQRLAGCNSAGAAQVLLESVVTCVQVETDVRLP